MGTLEPLYQVTIDGQVHEYALIKNIPGGLGQFVDPAQPDVIHELKINEQKQLYRWDIHWENYPEAISAMPFWRYLGNTLIVTFVGMAGMLFSCSLVAYGFSRFRARWLNFLFLLLLSTIMLPSQVRLIPGLYSLPETRLGGYTPAADRATILRQCLRCLPAPPVLHDHPAGAG